MPGARARLLAKRLAAGLLILALGSPLEAQYFGRNKVRYRAFDFQVLKTEHFDVYFYPREREGVEIAARLAERWYSRLERLFDHSLTSRQPLILYASQTDFGQTNVIAEELGEGTGGVTEPLRRRIILPLAGPIADTDHVLGHELVHAFQFDITAELRGRSGEPALSHVPLWFVEGMAEYLSLGSVDANAAMKVRDALRRDRLPSLHELSSPAYFPYQWGHAVFAYIASRYGDAALPRLLRSAAEAGNAESALKNVLGISAEELSSDWHEAIRASYTPVLAASTPIAATARLLVRAQGLGADLNIGPALSPDGRLIAFLSSRGLFSTDLFVADAATGHIVRKLTRTASDGHFSSIEFIHSAGAWDPSSQRVTIATIVGSRPALATFDARTGARGRDIVPAGVDEILNPSWSPDGHAIAFTAMRQGLTDLYVYDLRTSTLAQITNDAYADLHPSWAPDSRRIVFASDRFSSDLESLRMGTLQLALADTKSGAIEPIAALSTGKHINPQWSPDGQAVYFIGDPDGVPNVYRLSMVTHGIEQLTRLDTGVTGITPSSPALSVSSETGDLAISVIENEKYSVYIQDAPQPAGPVTMPAVNAAALPLADSGPGVLTALLSSPGLGLPGPQMYPTTPYKPTLSLSGISQPTAGIGVGRFGVGAGGGAALVFADLLGDHMLATAVQLNAGVGGSFSARDLAFETAYLNMDRRWNWGVTGGQTPYLSGGYDTTVAVSPAGALVTDREILFRQTERGVSGILAYPLDRMRRLESRGGFAQTSFEQRVTTTTSSVATGTVLSETSATQQVAPRLHLVTTSVALVSDSATFGPTSPIQGERYRLEASPAFGSVDFVGVLADYRRYVMPISFYTIAARVLHYGRYGEGVDDARLYPIYMDNPAFVRGYNSLDYSNDCVATPANSCDLVERLVGSRILVGNLELRFPLLRPFGVSRGMYGAVPIEVALFADTGVAWTGRETPEIFGGTRPGVGSAGVAVRVGLGAFVAELDWTQPFQRPGRGWVFGFNLIPGW